jgi:hypothetical protein
MLIPRLPCLLTILVATLGCSSEPFERASAKGQVTFSGQPIAKGTIVFVPQGDKPGASATADVVDGKYELPKQRGPSVGTHRVEILATRVRGKQEAGMPYPPGTLVDMTEQYIPAQFNHQSTLKVEIKAGANQHDFKLEAQAKR